jgi:hypothetical protein
MTRPAPSTIVVFVAVLLVTAAIVVAVGLGTDGATAIEVGDQKMSAADVNDELRAVVDNETFTQQVESQGGIVSSSPGSITATGAANLVTVMVYGMLVQDALDRAGERVTAQDRAAAQDLRGTTFNAAYSEFPRSFRRALDGRLAAIAAAQRVSGGDAAFNRFLERAARRTDIRVDPAYGRWSEARLAVVPYPTPFTTPQG